MSQTLCPTQSGVKGRFVIEEPKEGLSLLTVRPPSSGPELSGPTRWTGCLMSCGLLTRWDALCIRHFRVTFASCLACELNRLPCLLVPIPLLAAILSIPTSSHVWDTIRVEA